MILATKEEPLKMNSIVPANTRLYTIYNLAKKNMYIYIYILFSLVVVCLNLTAKQAATIQIFFEKSTFTFVCQLRVAVD